MKQGAQRTIADRRRRPTTHPWADAYLRAHGIEDAALRAEILTAILARTATRTASPDSLHESIHDESGAVMEEAQRFLDERLASFVGGLSPGHEAIAGRLVFHLVDGPAQAPAALLDPSRAPAMLRFQMRTARLPRMPAIARASMASRRVPAAPRPESPRSQRWLSLALCLLSLVLLTCQR
ncbi:MAG TPA: hypothetical protein VII72_20075 [Myxococcota bacterium]